EDGIRAFHVTGVQTCALPISRRRVPTPQGDYAATIEAMAALVEAVERDLGVVASVGVGTPGTPSRVDGLMKNCNSVVLNGRPLRSEERRVGTECRRQRWQTRR